MSNGKTPDANKLAPTWTSTQPDSEYLVEAQDMIPARVPGQRVIAITRDDQKPNRKVEVSVPHLPYEKWIDAEGNVRQVPMKTNRVTRGRNGKSTDDGNYYSQMERHYLACGWLRYDRPPTGVSLEQWAVDREVHIQERRTVQNENEKEVSTKFQEETKIKAGQMKDALLEALESFNDGKKERAARADRKQRQENGE